eukprot:5081024-Amphidinium_carterae.1
MFTRSICCVTLATAQAVSALLMSEPEPELGTDTVAPISVSVPVLLELEGLRLQAPCKVYVVWRLEGSPAGDFTHAGVH